MSIKVLYIDDQASARSDFERLLGKRFELITMPAPKVIVPADLLRSNPDIILVDYELTTVQPDPEQTVSYQGGTLATAIREYVSDRPILLHTRKNLFVGGTARQISNVLRVFDWVVFKSDLWENTESEIVRLESLARGYERLRGVGHRDWAGLKAVLGVASEVEEGLLKEAGPPIRNNAWTVLEVARWLQDVILEYPGILYNSLHAATLLGISEESFLSQPVQDLVRPALYEGPFAGYEKLYWRERLRTLAHELLLDCGVSGTINRAFGRAFAQKYGVGLAQAVCSSSGEGQADTVCYILHKPVKSEETVAYHPDYRPAVMDQVRVSIKAIRTSNQVDDALFDADVLPEIEAIRAGGR